MNNRSHLLLLLCCFISNLIYSQYYFYNDDYYDKALLIEVNAFAGGMNCFTDIGGTDGKGKGFIKDLNIGNTRFSGGMSVGFLYRYAVGLRLEANMGAVQAYDSVLKKDQSKGKYRYNRNLSFRSRISELLLLAEIYPLKLFSLVEKEKPPMFAPYLTGGFGIFRFRPQTELNGVWIDLAPLHTEGQGFAEYPERKPYALTQLNFPFGIGCRYEVSALLDLRLEILHRFTQTDYLDDVSTRYIDPALFDKYLAPSQALLARALHNRQIDKQNITIPGAIRGNENKKDAYFTIELKIGLVIGRERR